MSEPIITRINAHEILDSRGVPTVRAEVVLQTGTVGVASVPSGASTGAHEALELRDKGDRFGGKGVQKAVRHVEETIAPALRGCSAADQAAVDRVLCALDGTENKGNLGANATLAVSLAVARARAAFCGVPLFRDIGGQSAVRLPCPLLNVLNGGRHADNNVDIQEFMLAPIGASSFSEALEWACAVTIELKALLHARGLSTAVGDEGGFAPDLPSDEAALDLLCAAIEAAGFKKGEVRIALDAAASEWAQDDGTYLLPKRGYTLTSDDLITYWDKLSRDYPLFSLEDGLGEEDFDGFSRLTARLGERIQLVGDDLFVTRTARLKQGILAKACNAVLMKPNQVGTLTETLDTMRLARTSGYKTVVSRRSGETEDPFIADLAVGLNAGQIKAGAPCRGERVAKYNRLLLIERALADAATFGVI